jgi:hypothetical protein
MKMNERSKLFTIFVILIGFLMFLPSIGEIAYIENDHQNTIELEEQNTNDPERPTERGTRAGSPRTVLAELFTQWNCGPCAWANPAINELMDVYDSSQLVMISTHGWWPGANNDPIYLYNEPDSQDRISYYSVSGVPSIFFDGPPNQGHNGASSYSYYKGFIESELLIDSPMTITLDTSIDATSGYVTATIEITDTLPVGGDLKIKWAVVEDNIYGMGTNGEPRHRNGMRTMLTEESLPTLSIGETYTASRTFTLDPVWNYDSISIVVYVQYEHPGYGDDKEVLQAAGQDFIPQKILVVDDDMSSNPYGDEDYYHELLCQMEYAFDGWVYNENGGPSESDLQNYEAVIWLTGDTTSNTLTAADQTAISGYMDNSKGGLFLNGEDIGADIGATTFFWDYLHAFYNSDTTSDTEITGVSADPISDPYFMINLPITGSSPSRIDPWTNASTVFYYSPSFQTAAIKAGHDLDSRVVYFPFLYFEGSDSDSNKMDVMERVLNWMNVVDYVQIKDSPGDSGNVVSNIDLDVGESVTLWGAAYNNTYGFLENYPITTWTEDSGGSLFTISSPGSSTLVTAGLSEGSATLTMDHFGEKNTTTITINPPEPNYITLTYSPNGTEVPNITLLASEEVTIYASSYNDTSGFMGLADVNWDDSLGLGTFDNATGTSTTFQAGINGGITTITGDYISLISLLLMPLWTISKFGMHPGILVMFLPIFSSMWVIQKISGVRRTITVQDF